MDSMHKLKHIVLLSIKCFLKLHQYFPGIVVCDVCLERIITLNLFLKYLTRLETLVVELGPFFPTEQFKLL